jgi:hypothetical protein
MANISEVLEQLGKLSDRISTQVRTVAFGILIITWGLLIGKFKDFEITDNVKKNLIVIGAIAIGTMFLDFLQYFCGYKNTKALFDEMERENKTEGQFNKETWSYKLRESLFWIKQISLTVAVGWFIVILIYLVVSQI